MTITIIAIAATRYICMMYVFTYTHARIARTHTAHAACVLRARCMYVCMYVWWMYIHARVDIYNICAYMHTTPMHVAHMYVCVRKLQT